MKSNNIKFKVESKIENKKKQLEFRRRLCRLKMLESRFDIYTKKVYNKRSNIITSIILIMIVFVLNSGFINLENGSYFLMLQKCFLSITCFVISVLLLVMSMIGCKNLNVNWVDKGVCTLFYVGLLVVIVCKVDYNVMYLECIISEAENNLDKVVEVDYNLKEALMMENGEKIVKNSDDERAKEFLQVIRASLTPELWQFYINILIIDDNHFIEFWNILKEQLKQGRFEKFEQSISLYDYILFLEEIEKEVMIETNNIEIHKK